MRPVLLRSQFSSPERKRHPPRPCLPDNANEGGPAKGSSYGDEGGDERAPREHFPA